MAARTLIKIPDHVATILRDALAADALRGTPDVHFTIQTKLDPKVYKECAKVLEMLGGKWSRNAQATVFLRPFRDVLAEALDDGEVVNKKNVRQAFYTPPGIADLLISKACLKHGVSILEPEAGEGALIDAIERSGVKVGFVEAIEIDSDSANKIKISDKFAISIQKENFLEIKAPKQGSFDRIVMNPPFSNGQDAKHILHALKFLKSDGLLVAIIPPLTLEKETGAYKDLQAALKDLNWSFDLLPEGAFKSSGTGIATGILTVDLRG